MRLDLHLHSQASDGSEPPSDVVRAAAAGRLDVIALTDHDTTQGLDDALDAARSFPIEILPGIEMSTLHAGEGLHILGYFVDPSTPRLRAYESRAGHRREERMREMIQRLDARGVRVPYESVVAIAGRSRRSLGRPHLARALTRAGYADSVHDAFARLIGNRHSAYVPSAFVSAEEAMRIILDAGRNPGLGPSSPRPSGGAASRTQAGRSEGDRGLPAQNLAPAQFSRWSESRVRGTCS